LEDDSEGPRGREGAVGVERVVEALRLHTLPQGFGAVGADRDDGEAELCQLRFDLAQLSELRRAVGSPTSSIEDKQCALIAKDFRQVDRLSIERLDAHGGNRASRLQGFDSFGVRVNAVGSGGDG
jgi:hypothetical protein